MWRVFLMVLVVWISVVPIALAEPLPVSIYPSGASIPENLLRLSIVFAAPVKEPILPQIALRQGNTAIEMPFLEQELWSPDGKTLTVLLHPGRVKTGLIAHDKLGRVFSTKRNPNSTASEVALLINHAVVKQWHVEGEDRAAPNPTRWSVTTPQAGTTDALKITFEAPIDALSAQRIAVATANNTKVMGKTILAISEQSWLFLPKTQWKRGTYRILIHPRLEDAAGNEVGEAFEHIVASDAIHHSTTPARLAHTILISIR